MMHKSNLNSEVKAGCELPNHLSGCFSSAGTGILISVEGSGSNEVDTKTLRYLSEKINIRRLAGRHDNDPALTSAPPEERFKDAT